MSLTGLFRYLKLNKITRKQLTFLPALRDEVQVSSFLQLMGPVSPDRLISVDETSSFGVRSCIILKVGLHPGKMLLCGSLKSRVFSSQ